MARMARRGVDYWLIDIPVGRGVTLVGEDFLVILCFFKQAIGVSSSEKEIPFFAFGVWTFSRREGWGDF
jgi:hypothetical protein